MRLPPFHQFGHVERFAEAVCMEDPPTLPGDAMIADRFQPKVLPATPPAAAARPTSSASPGTVRPNASSHLDFIVRLLREPKLRVHHQHLRVRQAVELVDQHVDLRFQGGGVGGGVLLFLVEDLGGEITQLV